MSRVLRYYYVIDHARYGAAFAVRHLFEAEDLLRIGGHECDLAFSGDNVVDDAVGPVGEVVAVWQCGDEIVGALPRWEAPAVLARRNDEEGEWRSTTDAAPWVRDVVEFFLAGD